MTTISCQKITDAVKNLCIQSARHLPADIVTSLQQALKQESDPRARSVLQDLLQNQEIAAKESLPLCQDTGTAVLFISYGQEIRITGGSFQDAVQQGVAQGYHEGYLRLSQVDPFSRENTGDNTPAIIHTTICPGRQLRITLLAKGGGAENMSRIAMLKPADGIAGVKRFVIDSVRAAGANACPPMILGIGIGGNFEQAPLLAKQALSRTLGSHSSDSRMAQLEQELLQEINQLGIGPQGFGGDTTALGVMIEIAPCHMASLPVAININCHAARHQTIILGEGEENL